MERLNQKSGHGRQRFDADGFEAREGCEEELGRRNSRRGGGRSLIFPYNGCVVAGRLRRVEAVTLFSEVGGPAGPRERLGPRGLPAKGRRGQRVRYDGAQRVRCDGPEAEEEGPTMMSTARRSVSVATDF